MPAVFADMKKAESFRLFFWENFKQNYLLATW